jgi:hypothetical protein
MGYLDQFLAQVDNIRRTTGRNMSDLASDPAAYAEKIVGNLRNSNANVVPTAAGGELTNRPMTMEERVDNAIGNVDPGHGAGAVGAIKGQKELLSLIRRGELPGNQAIRYEIPGRALFDEGVVHYDPSGGKQAADILRFPQTTETGENLPRSQVIKNNRDAQFRLGDLSKIPEDRATFVPHDKWMYAYSRDGLLKPGEHQFYKNDAEGFPSNTTGMAIPRIKDILNDPELRRAWNMSLAVPANSDFHLLARILRDAK